MRYRVSAEAQEDLLEIFLYWRERANEQTADRIIDSIVERFWLLGEYPSAGKSMDEIEQGLQCFPAGTYLIYYRASKNRTDILHVFHGARDQNQAFEE
jgi:plasmid stabilization system protein ParE